MAVVGWVDPEQVAKDWADAPEDQELTSLLKVAFEVCSAYAPTLAPEAAIPERYKLAQVMMTKHLAARKRAGDGSSFGAGEFAISTYPLVLESRSLLRPKQSPFKGLR